jgi:hypothetical protein
MPCDNAVEDAEREPGNPEQKSRYSGSLKCRKVFLSWAEWREDGCIHAILGL